MKGRTTNNSSIDSKNFQLYKIIRAKFRNKYVVLSFYLAKKKKKKTKTKKQKHQYLQNLLQVAEESFNLGGGI